jgi:hypothetical protein
VEAHVTRVTEAMMSMETWTEPQASWVPLKTAVFKFGISEEASASSEDQIPAMSIAELTNVLKEKCGASSAAIDVSTATLSILFSDGRTRSVIGTPWKLLETIREVHIVPNSGHTHSVYLDEEGNLVEGYEENAKRRNKVRAAIDLIWRQLMLPAFDRAIATETIALYARSHIASPHFQRLPAHVWPLLKVADWNQGVAMAIDNTAFWAIHAELIATSDQLRVLNVKFAIDAEAKRVIFADGPELKGVAYLLILKLAEQFARDTQSGRPKDQFTFINTKELLASLNVDEPRLRARVREARSRLSKQFVEHIDYVIDEQEIIQSKRWAGYRLNPNLVLVEARELTTRKSAQKHEISRHSGKTHDTRDVALKRFHFYL